jgi:hypothetical protein
MTAHPWLRHPARRTPPPPSCPHGRPFATHDLAAAALNHGLGPHNLQPARCDLDGEHWHVTDKTRPTPDAGDCDANWTATGPAERLRAQLAALRDQHKSSDAYDQGVTSQELEGMTTVNLIGKYL